MENTRPSKRRRVENESLNTALVDRHSVGLNSAHSRSNIDAQNGAKVSRQSSEGRTRTENQDPEDVYDDIEGAHNTGVLSNQRQRGPPVEARLDSSRNQHNVLPTLDKMSARVTASLGLFKQYASPKKNTVSATTPENTEKWKEHKRSELDSEDELRQRSPSRTSVSNQKHRTYEDEIKAVAEAARRNVEDDYGWNILQRPKRRNAGVHTRDRDLTPTSARSSTKKPTPSRKPKSVTIPAEVVQGESQASPSLDLQGVTHGIPVKSVRHSTPNQLISVRRKLAGNTGKMEPNEKSSQPNAVVAAAASTRKVTTPSKPSHKYTTQAAKTRTPMEDAHVLSSVKTNDSKSNNRNNWPLDFADVKDMQTTGKASVVVDDSPAAGERRKICKHYTFNPRELTRLKDIILARLNGKRSIPLTGLLDEYNKVSTLVSRTIEVGESNSMLIIGARGTGKSALIEHVLQEHKSRHSDDFFVVRLNGFIHTDDKIALRDIWRQLGREMDTNDTDRTIKNYADTLSTLLALLSYSTENRHLDTSHITKSVVFIIDEFDLFTHHPRQTLLYNLFDIAQSRKAPIAVIGLTTRVDVTESLEKRVKSRFSHRYVYLSLPKSLSSFLDICEAALSVHDEQLMEYHVGLDTVPNGSGFAELQKSQSSNILLAWNALISDFLQERSTFLRLQRMYYTSKSVSRFLATQYIMIADMRTDQSASTEEIFEYLCDSTQNATLQPPDSSLEILAALSSLQLALLICAARLHTIYDSESTTFVLVYDEYKTLASKAKLQASASGIITQGAGGRISSKDVARDAWNELMECGLIIDDGRGNGKVDVSLEEIGACALELGPWGRWCREI